MHHIFNIGHIVISYGYWGIAVIAFLESGLIFALPGDSLLFTAGVVAAAGFLKIYYLVPIIFFCSFFGAILGFYIGENLEIIRRYSFFRKIIKDKHIYKAHIFFEKHGKSAVVFSRFVPIVRTFTPIVAGIAKMSHKSFVKYSLIGSFLWSTIVTLIGYFLGRQFPEIGHYMPAIILVVVVLSILPPFLEVLRHKK
ncbi:VTT domain-containing protein [Patescibacteria group bacterium]|nr:VTT domain-containing protein [Patescibacteria group bacterium]